LALTGKQRRHLRGLAHALQPVVQIGKAGATKALVKELDRAVEAHELVKIRALKECPTELDEILEVVEQALGTSTVGTVGKVAILYRARKKDPKIALPGTEKKAPKATARVGASKKTDSKIKQTGSITKTTTSSRRTSVKR
jgi:RNA-binding protein